MSDLVTIGLSIVAIALLHVAATRRPATTPALRLGAAACAISAVVFAASGHGWVVGSVLVIAALSTAGSVLVLVAPLARPGGSHGA